MKKYFYFIYYRTSTGKGNMEVNLESKIDCKDAISAVRRFIESSLNLPPNNVIICNFIFLREEDVLV